MGLSVLELYLIVFGGIHVADYLRAARRGMGVRVIAANVRRHTDWKAIFNPIICVARQRLVEALWNWMGRCCCGINGEEIQLSFILGTDSDLASECIP